MISEAYEQPGGRKVFIDSVHGTIRLNLVLLKIIDTPEFQRLRFIRQHGATYRVNPAASYSLFEHSLGVCHLASIFIEKLKANQSKLKITEEEVLCVEIAGLCHDIGHGPFSHLFDTEFKEAVNGNWKHEEISVEILKYIFERDIKKSSPRFLSDFTEQHFQLIYKLINPPETQEEKEQFLEAQGLGKAKAFLFEIVSNENGMNADHWDYFARDCLQLGQGNTFHHFRCMEMARVINGRICYRDKEKSGIYTMFNAKHNLRKHIYFQQAASAAQVMIAEAFRLAKDSLKFKGKRRKLTLDEIHDDVVAYLKATDDIYYKILNWCEPANVPVDGAKAAKIQRMKDAREILQRIEERDFYQIIERQWEENQGICDIRERCRDLQTMVQAWVKNEYPELEVKLVIRVINVGFGEKKLHPLDGVTFFEKGKHQRQTFQITKEELPEPVASMSAVDIRIRVYSKHSRNEFERLKEHEIKTFKEALEKEKEFGRPTVCS